MIDDHAQVLEDLRNLREGLSDLERQGLEDTPEYEELSDEYQALAFTLSPVSDDSDCSLYVYEDDYDDETKFGEYDSYTVACDIADEMIESGEITGYYILVDEEEEVDL